MATKIVLNKKNKNDESGFLAIQDFNKGKTKKSLGIKISVKLFNDYFNDDFNGFIKNTEMQESVRLEINKKITDSIYKFENNITSEAAHKTDTAAPTTPEPKIERLSFTEFFKSRIELKATEGHKYTYVNVLRKLGKYMKYLNVDDIYFDDLTPEYMVLFKNYCLTIPDPRKLKETGFKNYMRVITSVVNDTIKTRHYKFEISPFVLLTYDGPKKTDKTPMNKNQVQAFNDLDLDYTLSIARRMFFFQILGNGMRCSDVMFLRYSDFAEGKLNYKMMKTKNDVSLSAGLRMMMLLAEILGEIDVYNKYVDTVTISDERLIKGQWTLSDIDNMINEMIPQTKAVVASEVYDNYMGHIIFRNGFKMKRMIDVKMELFESINDMFVEYMQTVIRKQNQDEFVFLGSISIKSVEYFKNYRKGDVMSYDEFQKYRNLRNIYNNRLRKIEAIYNAQIPVNMKERANYTIKLSSHVARNTFVNIMLKEGVGIYQISHALVHSQVATTQNYLKSGYDYDAADVATKQIQTMF